MALKYLIGIDGGTQSSKVVVYDLEGNVVCEGRRSCVPWSTPEPGIGGAPRRRPVGVHRRGQPAGDGEVRRRPGATSSASACARSAAARPSSRPTARCVEPVMSWMDTRAYEPYMPDDPELAWVTTSSGYMTHRFTGQFRDSAANNILLQWPIDTDTWQWSDDPALLERVQRHPRPAGRAADAGRRRRLRDRRRGGGDRHPRGPAGRDHRQRQGRRGARLGLARRAHGAHLAGHLHRLHGARPREPQDAGGVLDQLRLRPATATSTRATACAAACGRSAGFSTCSGRSSPRRRRRTDISREEYLEREAESVPAGSDGLMTVLDWLAPTDKPFRKGEMHRLRRPAHQGPRVPLDPRGDRPDDEEQRVTRCATSSGSPWTRSSSRAAAPAALSSCTSSRTCSASRRREASATAERASGPPSARRWPSGGIPTSRPPPRA